MKPPSIAFVRQRYVYHGGAEQILVRTIAALHREGVQVSIITRRWQPSGPEVSQRAYICNPFHLGRMWRDWSFARSVCRLLPTLDADLVQSHERIPCCDVYRAGDGVHAEWLAQRARSRGKLSRLATLASPYHRYLLGAERRLFTNEKLRAVICNSRMVRDEVRRWFGVPEHKLHVIYNGVDTARFHPDLRRHRAEVRQQYAIPQDAMLFLFVGSGFERKGLRQAIEALARLPEAAFLMVVGKDRHAPRFVRRAHRLGLSSRVRFLGGQKDVTPFYGAADAFVLPTLYDPFPNAVLEAMAAGLPVVTSLKCGAAEQIENGRNGYVCDALDIDAAADAMRALLDPQRRTPMAAAARRTAEPLTLEAMSAALLELYSSLIPRSTRNDRS
jgi:UDP-glucose:(heptosyl)LPS alpha-1,3-glucosyltransferase